MNSGRAINAVSDYCGRIAHKLRVQLTDVCNLHCFYCRPSSIKWKPSSGLLSSLELCDMCRHLIDCGIKEIRLSGGEPTLRKDFEYIVDRISRFNVRKLGLTTNAVFLAEKLPFLRNTACQHINISLDSLNQRQFRFITQTDHFNTVHDTILQARQQGFDVKINMVLLRGINDREVFDFIKFSAKYKIEVRFLELMKIGPLHERYHKWFISAQDVIRKIEERESLHPLSVSRDSTSFHFTTSSGGKIGFIASESQPFCQFCSRLRLTAHGRLRACLFSDEEVDLRGKHKSEYRYLMKRVMDSKPVIRLDHMKQPMFRIGG